MVNFRINYLKSIGTRIMPKTYRRDLIVLFVVKLILLTGLFFACFSPKNRPAIGAPEATNLILFNKEVGSDARS
jgi:hypothetical protein